MVDDTDRYFQSVVGSVRFDLYHAHAAIICLLLLCTLSCAVMCTLCCLCSVFFLFLLSSFLFFLFAVAHCSSTGLRL